MKTKKILSIAIMATLPLTAHATDPVGPAAVPANGTPVVATANAPYVTQTPTAADATHIASTAYVKGAYNDAIAAVNKVDADKQDKLVSFGNNNAMYNKVFGGNLTGFGDPLLNNGDDGYAAMKDDIARQLSDNKTGNPDETLISTGAVLDIVRDAGRVLRDEKQDKLVAVTRNGNNKTTTQIESELVDTGIIPYTMQQQQTNQGLRDAAGDPEFANKLILATDVMNAIGILRVPIYTAWEADTTTKVGLAVALNNNE